MAPSQMTTVAQKLRINSDRLKQNFDALSEIGLTVSGGITRQALSNEDLEARAWFANEIEDAGLIIRDDEVGNLSGVLPAENPNAKTLLIGSHLDTVLNGGKYDGSIGVLAGLECLRVIREADLKLPYHLEVIDFTDEEGWWQSFFGSMGLTGKLKQMHINDYEQDNGAFRAALFRAGIRPSEVHRAQRDPNSIRGYLELHIEQSDSLETNQCDIGVVTGIVGRTTFNFTFYGEATHAATTAKERRRDALQGAAVFITEMHRMVKDDYPDGSLNCGRVDVTPGTFSVVPAMASLQVEVRHQDENSLSEMESRLVRLAQTVAADYLLSVSPKRVLHRPVAPMSGDMIETVEHVCDDLGYSHMRIVSYAGHDAQILSPFTPTTLIFIPSTNGISHNPKEFTPWENVEKGANTLLQTILRLCYMDQ